MFNINFYTIKLKHRNLFFIIIEKIIISSFLTNSMSNNLNKTTELYDFYIELLLKQIKLLVLKKKSFDKTTNQSLLYSRIVLLQENELNETS